MSGRRMAGAVAKCAAWTVSAMLFPLWCALAVIAAMMEKRQ